MPTFCKRVRATIAVGTAACAVTMLGGCGGAAGRRAAVEATVRQFASAMRAGQTPRACVMLAPETRRTLERSGTGGCPAVLRREHLRGVGRIRTVDVYGERARVVGAGDTVFLSRFADGWKLVAAGCEPRPGRPYRCAVKSE